MALETVEVMVGPKLLADVDQVSEEIAGQAMRALDEATSALRATTHEYLMDVFHRLERAHGQSWQPGGSGAHLFTRSGQGLRDILSSIKVSGQGAEVTGTIGLTGYMAVQEKGATVRPKKSKYLTVPLPAALDGRGIPLRRSAREWPGTFVARSRKGNLLIFQRRGRKITPLYVLKSSVTLPPRLRLEETINETLPFFEKRLFEQLSQALGA